MFIVKRDGTQVPFDKQKIVNAINSAFLDVDGILYETDTAEDIADEIEVLVMKSSSDITVESIQNCVEDFLMRSERRDVARAYIRYRYKKEVARNYSNEFLGAISEKLQASNVQNQNANVDEHSFGGRMGEATELLTKRYALDFCVSPMAKANHENNEVYIHDLGAYAVGMHNCAARETKFCTTYDGVRSFEDYEDGDQVSVLTHIGNHEMATVRKYGKQKLNKITFSFAGQRFVTERFTANHRWILEDGTETTELKIGDRLYKAPIQIRTQNEFSFEDATDKEKYYWCLGFVLADGTEAYRWSHGKKIEDIKFVRLRLCGDKIKYESRFEQLKHSTKEMANGDLYLTFSSVIGFRKIFPDLTQMTRREKHALFDGLYAADGQKAGSRKSILTTNEQIASFIEDEAPALGWFILNIDDKTGEATNYAIRNFTKEFTFIGNANKYYWTVVNIEEDAEEEVWCLEVEDVHSFVLPNGITTGNCLSVPFDDLLANGFNTRQTDVRAANSANTAFQLVAVLFQLQSLQQFGGVSATHLDWTMVPYIRKSFFKHYVVAYLKTTPDFLGLDLMGMLFDNYRDEVGIMRNRFEDWIDENKAMFLDKFGLTEASFRLDNKVALDPVFYQSALYDTIVETKQAVEGMYHNLNYQGDQTVMFGTQLSKRGKSYKNKIIPC